MKLSYTMMNAWMEEGRGEEISVHDLEHDLEHELARDVLREFILGR